MYLYNLKKDIKSHKIKCKCLGLFFYGLNLFKKTISCSRSNVSANFQYLETRKMFTLTIRPGTTYIIKLKDIVKQHIILIQCIYHIIINDI